MAAQVGSFEVVPMNSLDLKPFYSAAKHAGNKLSVTCRELVKRSHCYDPHNVDW